MTLTNATAVMTPKMRTQAPSSRRSVTRRTLLRLRAEGGQVRGRQRHDLHAVLLQLLVRRGGAVEPLPRASLLPRRHLDRRLAHEVAVRRREAVPRELGDGDDDGVDRVVPGREVFLRGPQLGGDDDGDDGVLLPVHRALLEGKPKGSSWGGGGRRLSPEEIALK